MVFKSKRELCVYMTKPQPHLLFGHVVKEASDFTPPCPAVWEIFTLRMKAWIKKRENFIMDVF